MDASKYAVTFACYNQVEYTQKCIESMIKHGFDLSRLVPVDNGSTDNTRDYLESLSLGECIFNRDNLGCGVAWNQGALALQAEWTIVMNNDVVVAKNWLENLIITAESQGLKIISPSLVEGELDYDFDSFSQQAVTKMEHVVRLGTSHAVCLAIHNSVWKEIGYFQATPSLWGFEDTLFFYAANKANIPMGITGSSWLHHFGSITQKAMKQERGLSDKEGLGYRYNYRLLQQNWLERKLNKLKKIKQQKAWYEQEIEGYGMTLYAERNNGNFVWG